MNTSKKSEIQFINFTDSDEIKKRIIENHNLIFDKEINEYAKQNYINSALLVLKKSGKKLTKNELENMIKQTFGIKINFKSLENSFKNSMYVLSSVRFNFRYYDINNLGFQNKNELLNSLNIPNGIYSSKYIFDKNKELMKELNIFDYYELHNLFKKINKNDQIKFSRMPIIKIGYKDKVNFFEDLLIELQPISKNEFVNYLCENYGYDKSSINSNLKNDIELYNFNKYDFDKNIIHNLNLFLNNTDFVTRKEIENFIDHNNIEKNYFSNFIFNQIDYKINLNYVYKKIIQLKKKNEKY